MWKCRAYGCGGTKIEGAHDIQRVRQSIRMERNVAIVVLLLWAWLAFLFMIAIRELGFLGLVCCSTLDMVLVIFGSDTATTSFCRSATSSDVFMSFSLARKRALASSSSDESSFNFFSSSEILYSSANEDHQDAFYFGVSCVRSEISKRIHVTGASWNFTRYTRAYLGGFFQLLYPLALLKNFFLQSFDPSISLGKILLELLSLCCNCIHMPIN